MTVTLGRSVVALNGAWRFYGGDTTDSANANFNVRNPPLPSPAVYEEQSRSGLSDRLML